MLIRSQDKTALVKFENIVVNLKLPDLLNVICRTRDMTLKRFFRAINI